MNGTVPVKQHDPHTGGEADRDRISLEHAWNWFKYHAEQRMMVFRFYLIMIGALGAGYVSVINTNKNFLAIVVAIFGAIVSLLFARLDKRVSTLIKIGEAAIAKEEQTLSATVGYPEIRIIEAAESCSGGWLRSYGKIFRAMFRSVTVAFALAALFAIAQIVNLNELIGSMETWLARI